MKMAFESTAGSVGEAPVAPQRRASSSIKTLLVGILIMGAITTMVGGGTFASFTAEVDNPGSIQTGTLVLEAKSTTPTTDCYSTDPAATSKTVTTANQATCAAFFNPITGGGKGFSGSQGLTIINNGSITSLTSATVKINCVMAANAIGGYSGSAAADLCSLLTIVVGETTDNTYSTLVASGAQLYGTCTTTAVASCTTGTTGPTTGTTISANLPTTYSGSHFYFVKVFTASTSDNAFQGRAANLQFQWKLTE